MDIKKYDSMYGRCLPENPGPGPGVRPNDGLSMSASLPHRIVRNTSPSTASKWRNPYDGQDKFITSRQTTSVMVETEHLQKACRVLKPSVSPKDRVRYQAQSTRYGDRETVVNTNQYVNSRDCVADENMRSNIIPDFGGDRSSNNRINDTSDLTININPAEQKGTGHRLHVATGHGFKGGPPAHAIVARKSAPPPPSVTNSPLSSVGRNSWLSSDGKYRHPALGMYGFQAPLNSDVQVKGTFHY